MFCGREARREEDGRRAVEEEAIFVFVACLLELLGVCVLA